LRTWENGRGDVEGDLTRRLRSCRATKSGRWWYP
jgi:hypothetical protein